MTGIAVGFSGTQLGMTRRQLALLRRYLVEAEAAVLHHGDCIGADQEAHEVARALNLRIVGHPPLNPRKRAWCLFDVLMPPAPYMVRNQAIVLATDLLLAAPAGPRSAGSGTWSTVQYAQDWDLPVSILPWGAAAWPG